MKPELIEIIARAIFMQDHNNSKIEFHRKLSRATLSAISAAGYVVKSKADIAAIRAAARDEAREQVAAFMILHGFATGHGDTLADLLAEMGAQLKERRAAALEEAAKRAEGDYIEEGLWSLNCERWEPDSDYGQGRLDAAAAIRALKGGEG